MQNFHVSDIVDVERLLETNHQTRTVHFHSQNFGAVTVVADFGSLKEERKKPRVMKNEPRGYFYLFEK